jgi:hypothetical protein
LLSSDMVDSLDYLMCGSWLFRFFRLKAASCLIA